MNCQKGADPAPTEGNEKFLVEGEEVGRGTEKSFNKSVTNSKSKLGAQHASFVAF